MYVYLHLNTHEVRYVSCFCKLLGGDQLGLGDLDLLSGDLSSLQVRPDDKGRGGEGLLIK